MAKAVMPSNQKKFVPYDFKYMLRSIFCLYGIQHAEMFVLGESAMLLNGKLREVNEIEIGLPAIVFDRVREKFPSLFDPKKKSLQLRDKIIARRLEVINKRDYFYFGTFYVRKLNILVDDIEALLRNPSLSKVKQRVVSSNLSILQDKSIHYPVHAF